jgi:hypothetical protein
MSYTANKLMASSLRKLLDFDPDATSATVVDLVPGASAKGIALAENVFQAYLVGVVRTVGTGGVTLIEIITADASDMTGNVTAIKTVAGTTLDAVGDTGWLECTGEEVAAAKAATNQYLGVRVTLATGTDECIVYFEAGAGRKADGLTANYVS